MRDARVVVVLGRSLPVLELIETTLRDSGHRVLMTTSPHDVRELARSIRIDVLVGDRGDVLSALEEEVRLVQPHVRVVQVCEPDELEPGDALARPVSLDDLEALVRDAA